MVGLEDDEALLCLDALRFFDFLASVGLGKAFFFLAHFLVGACLGGFARGNDRAVGIFRHRYVEACGQDGEFHLVAEGGVEVHAPDYVDIGVDVVYERSNLVCLVDFEFLLGVGVEIEVEQDALRPENVGVAQQRRVEGVVDSLGYAVFAFAVAGGDYCRAAVAQGAVHIVEVEVDIAVGGDDFGDAHGGHGEDIVGFAEGIEEIHVAVDFRQTLVVDNHEGVDIAAHFLGSVECLYDFLLAFEEEWNGDDADCKNLLFAGNAGNNG